MPISDAAILCLLAGLYLWECCARLEDAEEGFCEWWPGHWSPAILLVSLRGQKWVLFNPAPWSRSVVGRWPPPEAASGNDPEETKAGAERGDRPLSESTESVLWPTPLSQHHAAAVKACLDRLDSNTRLLRGWTTALFAALVLGLDTWLGSRLVAPVLSATFLWGLILVSWGADLLCTWGVLKSVTTVCPEERRSHIQSCFGSPFTAIRSCDLLFRRQMPSVHPWILPLFLYDRERALSSTRQNVAELTFPVDGDCLPRTGVNSDRIRLQLLKSLLEAAAWRGISRGELFSPPVQHPGAVSFCPRCFCQYVWRLQDCPDCPGVEVVEFVENGLSRDTVEFAGTKLSGANAE